MNLLLNVDALGGLGQLPESSIHLTVTSPPYDNTFVYGGLPWSREVWEPIILELFRVTAPGGMVAWQVRDGYSKCQMTCTSERQVLFFVEGAGFRKYEVLYSQASNGRWKNIAHHRSSITPVYLFSKGKPKTINLRVQRNKLPGTLARFNWRNPDGSIKRFKPVAIQEWGIKNDLWRYATGAYHTTRDLYAFEHPAMMPEKLARDLILSYSDPGDVVLDPFGGAATTAKMAMLNYRKFVSLEPHLPYHLLSERRIRGATAQLWEALP